MVAIYAVGLCLFSNHATDKACLNVSVEAELEEALICSSEKLSQLNELRPN